MLDLPQCNAYTFQVFIDEFAKENPDELKVVFLDNGAFHKAKRLRIPENICFIFLPAYSPELNGAEKVWWMLKREINRMVFNNIGELQKKLERIIKEKVNNTNIKSLTGYKLFLSAYQTIINV
jgi:transposase